MCHDMESDTDYRKLAHPRLGMYFTGPDRDAELDATFHDLTNNQPVGPARVEVQMGRTLAIEHAGAVSEILIPSPLRRGNTTFRGMSGSAW